MGKVFTNMCEVVSARMVNSLAIQRSRRGQGTTEYVAAIIIGLVIAVAAKNALSGGILDSAINKIKTYIGNL